MNIDDLSGWDTFAAEPGGGYAAPSSGLLEGNQNPPRLLDRLRAEIRLRHYSLRTEEVYVGWARRYIVFHGKRHPKDMGAEEITRFLSWLASERNVSASTQNQAKAALLFLYAQVLKMELPWLDEVVSARVQRRLPGVLTPAEVRSLLAEMSGVTGLLAALLYGAGLRLLEGLRLRVKDVEFERREITVRQGKGNKDRVTVLPKTSSCRCSSNWRRPRRCTTWICRPVSAPSGCPTPWP